MKYVCFEDYTTGIEKIIIFPRTINHNDLARMICRGSDELQPISAGFVCKQLKATGRSESLDLDSRPEEDTLIIKHQMNMY